MKITIDPGHGAKGNPYPTQSGYYEGTQMWKLAQYLAAELQKYGVDTSTTRPSVNDDPEVYSRGKSAAKGGSAILLSLHSNAADTTVTGTEVFYSVKGTRYKDLSERLASKVASVMGHNSRGAKTRTIAGNSGSDYYGVIRGAADNGCTCALIIEHGFHTNAKDAAFLVSDANLQKLAATEADVIAQYFSLKAQTAVNTSAPSPSAADTPQKFYKIQLGAYTQKANADAMLAKVRAAGFDAVVKFE